MKRNINIIASWVCTFIFLSLSTDACQDILPLQCQTQLRHCNISAIRRICRVTCDDCPNDPCTVNNGGCDHKCNWTGEIAICSCQTGFRLANDNRTCEDINECTDGPNPCLFALPVYCVNTVGSYFCQSYKCKMPTMNYYRSGECCSIKNSMCGLTPSIRQRLSALSNRRILGGFDSAASAWPWMAQILYAGGPHCGASLISNRWMLAAAHCFRGETSYQRMTVYLGQIRSAHLNFLDTTRRIQRRISRVIKHEEYEGNYNDIALVQLDQPVEFNDFINSICLPCGEVPSVGDKCWATGFGRTESSELESSNTLREVDLPIVSSDACVRAYASERRINPNMMMCAGYPEGKKDACLGDSGGPLACQRKDSCEWYLSGITSFGKGCALPGYYGVYVNVVNYENWIRETLGEDANGLCRKRYSPCRELNNVDKDCYSKLHRCTLFPWYMNAKCKLACCQLRNEEITDCKDDPASADVCMLYAHECNNPVFSSFMRGKCKKTCKFC